MKRFLQVLAIAAAFSLLLAVASCTRNETASPAAGIVRAHELPLRGWVGDETYARVRTEAIPGLHEDFAAVLHRHGMPAKWDRRLDCNRFAGLWIGLAQARYAIEQWHSRTAPQALALAEVWYRPEGAAPGVGHAIVAAETDRGLAFIEPQTGGIVHLSGPERASVYFVRW